MERSPGCLLPTVLILLVLSLSTFVGVTLPVAQQTAPATTIFGVAQDQDSGQPIEGITVQLWRYPYPDQSAEQYATTGADGRFEFAPLSISTTDSITITVMAGLDWLPQNVQRSGADTLLNPEFNLDLVAAQLGVGDLGWRALAGQVIDADTRLLVEGVEITYSHFSYMYDHPAQSVFSDAEGYFVLDPVFIHDTDGITLNVETPGYAPFRVLRPGLEAYWQTFFEIELSSADG